MLTKLFEFLSEKARGLLLTLGSTGVGTLPQVIEKIPNTAVQNELSELQDIQLWVYRASFTVAVLTIISYLYKFVIFIQKKYEKYKTSKKEK